MVIQQGLPKDHSESTNKVIYELPDRQFPLAVLFIQSGLEMANNTAGLSVARANKKDEFYTQRTDIEKELNNYNHLSKNNQFKDKVVFCNCDDPTESHFFRYFADNFVALGLKKLICTHYEDDPDKKSYILTVTRGVDKNKDGKINRQDVEKIEMMFSNGDFRSDECVALLKESDIVCTNPPFSLFREYVAQLIKYKKKFLIIGNQNAITYKEIFPLIKENKMWLGESMNGSNRWFSVPDDYETTPATKIENGVKYVFVKAVVWFTNMNYQKRHDDFVPKKYKKYYGNESDYPTYDNYDAINVNNVNDIPIDYDGIIGVPITFLHKHNPEQFEIVGITKTWYGGATKKYPEQKQISKDGKESIVSKLNDGATLLLTQPPANTTYYVVDNKYYIQQYARILIKRIKNEN